MKNALLAALIAVLASLLTFYFLGGKTPSVPDQKESAYERVMRTGTIRCGYGLWDPWVLRDAKNQMKGGMVQIWQEVGKRLNLEIEWTAEIGFGQAIEELKTNRFDVFCGGLWENAFRGKQVAFTIPIFYMPQVIAVRENDTRFDDDYLKLNSPEHTITIMDGEMSVVAAQKVFPKADHLALPQMADAAMMLMNVATKKSDATIVEPEIIYAFNRENQNKLKIISPDKPLSIFPTAYPVRKEDHSLRMMLNYALNEIVLDGTLDRIIQNTLKYPSSVYTKAKPYEVPNAK